MASTFLMILFFLVRAGFNIVLVSIDLPRSPLISLDLP